LPFGQGRAPSKRALVYQVWPCVREPFWREPRKRKETRAVLPLALRRPSLRKLVRSGALSTMDLIKLCATGDPKEEPKDKLEKLAFLWNKVVEKDKPPYDLSIPWKTDGYYPFPRYAGLDSNHAPFHVAEAPQWFKDLDSRSYEPDVTKLNPLKTGYRYYLKRLNRDAIKTKNRALAEKDFKVLPKRRKQTSP